mgnify:CR=1 FL=1
MNISSENHILAQLPGKQVLVAKQNTSEKISDEEQLALQKLKKRDQEVRTHEGQHMSNPELTAIGGPNYTYTIGPDGKPYITGGNVTVSTGAIKDPDDAIRKARAMQNASLSVGEPSTQDLAAAGAASAMEMDAVVEKASENKEKNSERNVAEFAKSEKSSFDVYA